MPEVKTETSTADPEGSKQPVSPPAPDRFTLAHISDLHLTTLNGTAIGQLFNKRMLGYLSWRRKRRLVHRLDIVEALLEDLRTNRPDHIAVTGDLTHLGLADEFTEAGQWLARLGPPDRVTVIPGNHEAYVGQDWAARLSVWAAYLNSDDGLNRSRTGDFFPSLRIRGKMALIGLCSARPSLPFLAVGSLDEKQLGRLPDLLMKTGAAGLLRVILIHHPPVPGAIKWRKRLTNDSIFAEIVARYGAELVLHGHTHAQTFSELQTPSGKVPVIGAASASELNPHAKRCAQYNLYEIKEDSHHREIKMLVRSYSEESGKFVADQATALIPPHGSWRS